MANIRVLVVDDHDLVRASIKRVLTEAPQITIVGEASSGEQAVKLAASCLPQVVLLDLRMPSMDGLETAQALLRLDPTIKVLIVSICLDELLLPRLFQGGVSGYFNKSGSAQEMIRAIQVVSEGQHYLSPVFTQQLGLKPTEIEDCFSFDALSEREFQVVIMLIAGQTISEISEKLDINRKTINSYRGRSFQKLNIKNDVELTLLAARQGLLSYLEMA